MEPNGTYNFTITWGDGESNLITTFNQSELTHTYNSPGMNTLNITGTIIGWNFNYNGDPLKIIQISNWGPLMLKNIPFGLTKLVKYLFLCKNRLNKTF